MQANLDSNTPARCPRKRPPNRQQRSNPPYTNNSTRNQLNGHNDPNLQLSISTSKLDHIAELLETTRKITIHFKKSYQDSKSNHISTDSHHPNTKQNNAVHSDKQKCKSCNTNDQVNEIIGQTPASTNTKLEHKDITDLHDSDSPDSNLESSSG